MRHYATLYAIKALYQPSAPEWIAASLEIRRKRYKAKHRNTKPRKRRVFYGYSTAFNRKYGMFMDDAAVLLGTTNEGIRDLAGKRILGHRIKLAKLRKKS